MEKIEFLQNWEEKKCRMEKKFFFAKWSIQLLRHFCLQELLLRPGFQDDVAQFCLDQNSAVVVMMSLHDVEGEGPSRELAVYSGSRIFKDQVIP